MLVVKRPFRNYGVMLLPGQVVTAESVKRCNGRLKHGFLIDIAESDIAAWNKYFIAKYGVSIMTITKPAPVVVKAVLKSK